ncbi:unnamed protein product [Soboliphyme baturini]|uniref:Uncharacterized protein n=1 Tax=Soboliphyme baturini TaxID=241478 RepID=A0A183IHL5_9BILA|nr:unnamed protein product [Soboliphyme baturini]
MDNGVLCPPTKTVVTKAELGLKTKLPVAKSIRHPMLGHESWAVAEKLRSREQEADMGFLGGIVGSMRLGKVGGSD